MTPFEVTLEQIRINYLDNIVRPFEASNIKKISLQGCNKPGNTQLVFTIFTNDNKYHLEFCDIKNFRFYRTDADKQEELEHLSKYFKLFSHIFDKYIT